MNNAGSSQTAGSTNIKPNTDYTLKLSDTDIYLTYSHIKKQLKATWSPKKPEHSDIEWKSSDESIAKVSSDGTVRGVSSGLNKNGLMARDESKTRKCIITAIGGGGLAKATCTVHVMPDSHYEAIKDYADKAGITTSGDNLRDAMEYAYNQGAKTIAITDGKFSPMVKSATVGLIARSDMVSFVDSLVAPLSLINAILVSISMNRKDKIVDSLDKLERMWGEYQVYSSTNLKKYL